MMEIEYTTDWGETVRLVVCTDHYKYGGALALLALDVTNPDGYSGVPSP